MAKANPNPTRVPEPLWRFWIKFDELEPTAQYGGTYAPKSGYHNYPNALRSTDYSLDEVAADRKGSRTKCSAIDLTMSAAAMVKYTKRLDAAARAKDKRLYIGGVPIIREFIGTKDNKTVYCYVLTGGRAQGVGADAGPDYGRDRSHLWHIHISIIRQFCESAEAYDRLFSVISGESLAAWEKRTGNVPVVAKPKPAPAPAKPAPKPAPKPTVHKPGSRELKYVPSKLMSGADVAYVQKFIGPARAGKADGIFGARTRDAVIWYQRMRGLPADGIVGKRTFAAMGVR